MKIAKKIFISSLFLLFVSAGTQGLLAQVDNNTAQLSFNKRTYEGSVNANISVKPFKIGASSLHGIRFQNTDDPISASFFVGLNVGWQPWVDGHIVYYAVHPRIYFPSTGTTEYYFGLDLGGNSGITTLRSGETFSDIKFYFTPMLGAMIDLNDKLALDLAVKLQLMERSFSAGGTQVPIIAFGAGIRF